MIKAIILDMDGLLIDSEPFWQEIEREIFMEFGIFITEDMQHDTFGLRTDEQIKFWYNYKPWPDPDFKKIEQEYDARIKQFFLEKGVLLPGSKEIIEFFRNKGYPVALASSSSMDLIMTFLDKFNLNSHFAVIHSAENEEYGKPHPAVYIETARKLNVHPSSCLAFEDSLNGVIAAKAAKMKVVAIPDPKYFELPGYAIADYKIRSLEQFSENTFEHIDKYA